MIDNEDELSEEDLLEFFDEDNFEEPDLSDFVDYEIPNE